jgi:predicted small lipoprotein YifL
MRAILIAAAIVLGLVLTACGDSGPAETPAAARAAIEALPYRIDLREPPGEPDALVGTIHAGAIKSLFYVFVHGGEELDHRKMVEALGGPDQLPLEDAELTDDYEFLATPAPNDEVLKVEFAVEDALCEQATGETCGV